MLPGRNKEWVLAVASGVASELGMKVEMTTGVSQQDKEGNGDAELRRDGP